MEGNWKLDLSEEMGNKPVRSSCEIIKGHSLRPANFNLLAIARVDSLSAGSVLVSF